MNLLALPLVLSSFVLVGDSIVSNDLSSQSPPIHGWGIPLTTMLSPATVSNLGVAGTSSRSYYDTYWNPTVGTGVVDNLQSGDFVLIEFGHNDISPDSRHTTPSEYATFLTSYVNESRAQGATPILVTPLTSYVFSNNIPVPHIPEYVTAMRGVATTLNVQLIDLHQWSIDRFTALGEQGTKDIFQVVSTDLIHMTPAGAVEAATFISGELAAVPEPSSLLCMFVVAGLTQSRRVLGWLRKSA